MFKFKGISSKDMQVVIEEEEHFIARASRRYETTEIEGRDGAIFEELGYSYVERPIYVQCLNVNKIDNILAWLDGEGEFEYKGRKTTARFYSELEPQREGYIRIIDTTFIRDPFWTKLDDEYIEVKGRKDKTTEKASNINVKDSSDLNAKVDVYGISEQDGEPSPSNIVDIENVTGDIDITVCNKNLFNNTKTISNVTYNSEEDKWIFNLPNRYDHIAQKGTFFKNIKANTNYTLYFNILKNTSSAAILFNLTNTIWNNNIQISAGQTGVITNNIKTKEDLSSALYDLWFSHSNAITGEFEAQIMICEGSETDNNYVKYQEQLITFPLQEGQKLMKGDYLADDGIHHKRKQVEFNGTENWELYIWQTAPHVKTTIFSLTNVLPQKNDIVKYCNYFNIVENTITNLNKDEAYCLNSSAGTIYFSIPNEIATTTEQFKNWLAQQKQAGTPIIVEYELATEEIEPYTEEQQEAYNKLQNVLSYYNVTNVFTNQGLLEFKYIEDTTEKITNEGSVYSRPILRLEKTICNEVDIMIEDVRFQYDFNDEEYVEIDCEEKEVKYEGLNRNRKIQIGYEFPKLKVGENKIKMYGGDCIIKAKRKDRWL